MASAIIRSTYRYKRPPRKRKPVALEAPAIVSTKSSHCPSLAGGAAAEVSVTTHHDDGGPAQPSTPRETERVPAPPANDDRESAIVTATDGKQARRQREPRQEADDVEGSRETKDLVDRMMLGRWPGKTPASSSPSAPRPPCCGRSRRSPV